MNSVACPHVVFAILALVSAVPSLAGEQPAAAPPPVVLPMERANYFIGEDVLIGVVREGFTIDVVDAAGTVVGQAKGDGACVFRLATARLAPGAYTIRLDGQPVQAIGLASTERESIAALTDEVVPEVRKPEDAARLVQTLKESGINAVMADGVAECGRHSANDSLAATGTMLWLNPYTRPMSFNPARVYEPELKTFRHRLVMMAQANSRYPTFGGFMYDWDPVGHLNRKMLLFYWGWGNQEQGLRNYLQRSDDAVYDEFRKRTKLEPVSTTEYIKYCLSIGHPEFAPAIDLPTYRWIWEMAADFKPLPKDELAKLEARIDAWANFLMGIYGESITGHQAALAEVMPGLRNTTSVNIDHCPIRDGQWHPAAYAPLDFRYMTTWNDQIAGPDYTYQWLFTAGILDIDRPWWKPLWLGSSLGTVHALAPYPGKFMRMAAHDLAYGGTGLGFALEGFSNVLGGMNKATNWQNMKGKAGEQDLISGREFLKRFAPLALYSNRAKTVALFYSKAQMRRQHITQKMGSPQFNAFITLARLGYTPRFITEEQIVARGNLRRDFSALVIVNQSVPLSKDVLKALAAFKKGGGRIVIDKASEITIDGAETMDVQMAYSEMGKPHNWTCPNIATLPHAVVAEQTHAKLAPAMLAALGNAARTALIPEKGAASLVSTFQLDDGDTQYVVAVNDAIQSNQSDWIRHTETLVPNGDIKGELYDVTAERHVGPVAPVKCEFNDLTARVYAILPRPLGSVNLEASQNVKCGGTITAWITFADADGKRIDRSIPCCVTITDAHGREVYRLYMPRFWPVEYVVPENVAAGQWQITARCLLDGSTATLPITVAPPDQPGGKLRPVNDTIIIRNGEQLADRIDKGRSFVLPLFSHHDVLQPVGDTLREELGKRKIEVRDKPGIVTYTVGYDPTDAEKLENAQAENGDAFGKIKVTTVNRNDYAGTLSGWIFGKDVILLDLVGVQDNPMAESLDTAGMLWPKASAAFPGPGKAIVQIVKGAFSLGADAIVIQSVDISGLMAGAKAIRRPKGWWYGDTVKETRRKLLRQFFVPGGPIGTIQPRGLTSNGIKLGNAPQPLAIAFVGDEPPAEAKPFQTPPPAFNPIPGEFEPKSAITYFKVGDGYEQCFSPGPVWHGDLRFSDALLLKVDAARAGKFTVELSGTFRYNDRKPTSQSNWEDLLALYNAMPKQRKPASFDVWIDGKPAASLTTAETGQITYAPRFGGGLEKTTETEEGTIKISGTVDVPAGKHDVLLIHRNIVDGKVEKIVFGQ